MVTAVQDVEVKFECDLKYRNLEADNKKNLPDLEPDISSGTDSETRTLFAGPLRKLT